MIKERQNQAFDSMTRQLTEGLPPEQAKWVMERIEQARQSHHELKPNTEPHDYAEVIRILSEFAEGSD